MIFFDGILALPSAARLSKPFPKAFFTRHDFALSPAEKRLLNTPYLPLESEWMASLKPSAGNVPAYRRPPGLAQLDSLAGGGTATGQDPMDYLEIQYFRIQLREVDFKKYAGPLARLYHRYLPYPLLLVVHGDLQYRISAATKEIPTQTGKGCTNLQVFESPPINFVTQDEAADSFQQALAFPQLNTLNLKTTYASYLAAITALGWQEATGQVTQVAEPHLAYGRLRELRQLERERDRLTTLLRKSKRMTKRVELQTELSRVIQSLKTLNPDPHA